MDINERTPFGQRLVLARENAGISQENAARTVGMSQGTLSEAEVAGKRSGYTSQLAALYQVNPVWLATGKGNMVDMRMTNLEVDHAHSSTANRHRASSIDILCVPPIHTPSFMQDSDEDMVMDMLRLSKTWLDQHLGTSTSINTLAFIHAVGDSMFPTFNDSDILLVDTEKKPVKKDNIYVLNIQGRLFIKRVRQRIDGTFEISSDNPAIKTVDSLTADADIEIKGRVIWIWSGRKV